ncbi:MAG: T9SS type A sorting domain-containing protein [Ignavibacteriales bacterium]|nr:T9SS type A sorting domain-containing protein [Ignavibacteriales bacterium]
MKKCFLILTLLFLQTLILSAQDTGTITGKLVDQNGIGLGGLQLKLYISSRDYPPITSMPDGSFTFNNISNVKDEQLPTGYIVSANYPNPFNPKTRIDITLPNSGNVRVEVYNLLGQSVRDEIEKYFSVGESYIDLELNGLPNGFYLARITLSEKYSVIRKLMLIYGGQHLSPSIGVSNFRLNKSTLHARIDSLVVTGTSISRKVFTNLQDFTVSPMNLGNLVIGIPPQVPLLYIPVNGATNISVPLTLNWYAVGGATSYTLQVSANSSFSNSIIFNQNVGNIFNQQITGLNYSATYYWRVSATNNNVTSDWSSPWSFTTQETPHVPPSTPILSSPSNGEKNISLSPTLSWNASNYATSYTLQVSIPDNANNFNENRIICNGDVGNNTNQQLTGLYYSTKYVWRVSATNSYGTSAYSPLWLFTTTGGLPCPGTPTVYYEGKTYNTVQIGTQCWLTENLNVGTMVQGNQNQSGNGIIEKYCINNDTTNCTTYGGLYLWDEAMQYGTAGNKGICPTGWHIPTQVEFQTLSAAVNGNSNLLKAAIQPTSNGTGTNASGFSALLVGMHWTSMEFQDLGSKTTFWSSYSSQTYFAYTMVLTANNSTIDVTENGKNAGFSVRCIKD